jgi:hypothetical protein
MFVSCANSVPAQTVSPTEGFVRQSLSKSALLEAERIGYARQPSSQSPPAVAKSRSWAGRHTVLLGTLIGTAAGTAIAAGTIASGHPENGEPGAVMALGIFAGVGGGTLIGLLISAVR